MSGRKQFFKTITTSRPDECRACGEAIPVGTKVRWNGSMTFHFKADCNKKKRQKYIESPERQERVEAWEKENPTKSESSIPTKVQKFMDAMDLTADEVKGWKVGKLRNIAATLDLEVEETGKNGATKTDFLRALGLAEKASTTKSSGRGGSRKIKGR